MHGATRSPTSCQPQLHRVRSAYVTQRVTASSLLSVTIAAVAAHAQPASPPRPTTLDPVVVTASRTPQPISDLLADLTVIQADEILRSGAQSLPQLLQRQPGVEVTINGGAGATSGAFLRGANAGQTLVLIDGLRVGSSSVGATALEAIPLDQVERIEILRGPASSLYGADAIGGVIQVFTKRAEGNAFAGNVAAGYGTYNTTNVNAGLRGAIGDLRFSVQAGGTNSTGFNAIVNPDNFGYNNDRDGYASANVGLNAVLPWAAGQEVAVQYFRNRLNNQSDGGPGFDDRTITTLEAWSVVSRNRINDDLDLHADRRRRQRRLRVAIGVRHVAVQDHAAAIPVAERRHAAAGRAVAGLRAPGGAARHRRGVCDHRTQHQFGDRRVSAALRRMGRCRRTCAATTRASTAARPPAASRWGTSSRRPGA